MSRGERRRQERETGSDMKKFYLVLTAVAVIGIGAVGYSVGAGALGTAVSEPIEVEGLDDMERLIELAQGVTKGDEQAPITVVEFGDYQCPGCGAFALSVKPQIDLSYVETGRAKFVFYDFPLIQIHPHAFLAARAARCAGDQGSFWEYHDELFRNQSRWSGASSAKGLFEDYGETVGLDMDEFEACVNSDRYADVVTANMQLGVQLGVGGTPTILISGGGQPRRLNNYDFASIRSVIEDIEAGTQSPGGD